MVIVSDRFWAKRFARGADAIGASVRINNVAARIVGVAPAGFFGLRTGQWADAYAPLAAKVAFQSPPGAPRSENDRNWWVRQVGRLKPGIDEAAAGEEIRSLFRNLAVPEGTTVEPAKIPTLITLPGGRGVNALNSGDVNALWILLLLVGVLLLIVCANVANLLLSRAVGRQRESTVRLALGAPRARLFRQHLIESGMLALIGGAAGLAVGYALAQSIHVVFQTGRDASNAFDLHLDPRVLAFTSLLSLLTALLFGLAPAAQAARGDLNGILKAQTKSVMAGRLRLPRLLVTVQIALCLAALVAAGLLGRSLEKLKWTDIGFDRENLLYASVSPSRRRLHGRTHRPVYGTPARGTEPATGRRERQPRVHAVAVGRRQQRPREPTWASLGRRPPRRPERRRRWLLRDASDSAPRRPDLLSAATWTRPPRSRSSTSCLPLGSSPIRSPSAAALASTRRETIEYEIIGVVGSSRYNTLRRGQIPAVYQPYRPGGTIHFAIRTTIDAASLAEPVRRAVAAVDPAVPLNEFHTQTALIDRMLRTERMLSYVSGAFGLLALALAAIGLGGLLAYATARRTNEIGVRMALGAARSDVVRMIVRDSVALVATGILVGLPCAYAVGRFLTSSLFQLEPFDVPTSAAAVAVLLVVALIAAWVPARRAARIDPILALREE